MTEQKQSKKWIDPPPGYTLKSDIPALCKAVVEKWTGKSFGEFYVSFCTDLYDRYSKYGSGTMLSDKQKAILHKLEINNWPEGLKAEPKPASVPFGGETYATEEDCPF